jgi:hypothetical protein
MRTLTFGRRTVAVSTGTESWPALDGFLHRATTGMPGTLPHFTLHIVAGSDAALVVDDRSRSVTLTVPAARLHGPPDPSLHIGVLQAAARCLALVDRGEGCALLHGSAVDTPAAGGVAVLDGGAGAGKTSLALAVAAAGGHLLVDEFLLADTSARELTVAPSPRLPWHVRADMAPWLTPNRPSARLHHPDDLQLASTRPGEVPIAAILVPDPSRQPGEAIAVEPLDRRTLLRPAVHDHRSKLLDPRLDHVSLFSSPGQILSATGGVLAARHRRDDTGRALDHLAGIPTFLIGLGRPDEIGIAARTSLAVLHDELAPT